MVNSFQGQQQWYPPSPRFHTSFSLFFLKVCWLKSESKQEHQKVSRGPALLSSRLGDSDVCLLTGAFSLELICDSFINYIRRWCSVWFLLGFDWEVLLVSRKLVVSKPSTTAAKQVHVMYVCVGGKCVSNKVEVNCCTHHNIISSLSHAYESRDELVCIPFCVHILIALFIYYTTRYLYEKCMQ